MSDKIEGTMRLEGLLEGTLPPFPDAKDKVEKWSKGFAKGLVRMSVQIDGSHFSALPSNEPFHVKTLSPDGLEPSNVIADGIADLLRYFPPLERSQVFSTVRSIEYRPKQEVQTLYAVGPDGRAVTRQQIVPADTTSGDAPVSSKDMMRRGMLGLIVAIVLLGASAFVVPYGSIWRNLTAHSQPAGAIADEGAFSPYLILEVQTLDLKDGTLHMKLTRTAVYPLSESALDKLYENPPADAPAPATTVATASAPATTTAPASASAPAASATASAPAATTPATKPEPLSLVRRRLALEAIAKNTIRLDLYDKAGATLGTATIRIDALATNTDMEISIAAPQIKGQPIAPATVKISAP